MENFNDLPDHLKDEIILEIHPKYIHIIRTLIPILDRSLEEKYEKKWYYEFKDIKDITSLISLNSYQKLDRSLKLEYYELFNRLFKDYTRKYSLTIKLLNQLLATSAFIGNVNYLKMMLNLGATNYNEAMIKAAEGGPGPYNLDPDSQIEIVKLMLDLMESKGIVPNYNGAMLNAAHGGQIEIVKLMLDLMNQEEITPEYNGAMFNAAHGGQIEILKLMLDLMNQEEITPEYNWAMGEAAHSGQIEIVKLMSELMESKGIVPDYNWAMTSAAHGGQIEIVKLMLDLMILNRITPEYNQALDAAEAVEEARHNLNLDSYIEIIDFLKLKRK